MEKTAGILFTDGHSILLLRKKSGDAKGRWGLPGGHAESFDKNVLDTAKREAKEETGLKNIPGKQIDSHRENFPQMTWTTFIYQIPKTFSVKISLEHDASKWVPISKIDSLNLHPNFKKHLPYYLGVIRKKIHKNFSEWLEIRRLIDQRGTKR